jgi:glutamate synthase domain-containing protein 3
VLIAKSRAAIDKGEKVQFMEVARNVNRSVGAMLSGAVTKVHPEGLPDDTIRIQLEGTGGQSFGAFLANGITLYLIGDANDYTGKGLSGGRVVVRPSIDFRGVATQHIIVGNTVMYGATTGEAFFSGVAGERFAVRLSGATAVVEGTGDHGCEYMTGGTVAVLGKTGRNFAAGMSGGVAYVYDEDGQFAKRCNTAMVTLEKCCPPSEQEASVDRAIWHRGQTDEAQLRKLLEDHNRWTGSKRARELLDNWAEARGKFVKVFPNEYKRALGEIHAAKSRQPAAEAVKLQQKRSRCGQVRRRPYRSTRTANHGKSHRLHGIRAHRRGLQARRRAPEALQGIRHRPGRRAGQGPGRALHGLRHAVLQQRLPGQQHHSGLQRSGVPRRLEERDRGAAQHQQLPRVHRPHLPRALRGGLHAECERRRGGHQVHRARHHRPRLGRRLGQAAPPSTRPARRWPWWAPARPAWLRPSSWRAWATT